MSGLPKGWVEATINDISSVQLGKMLDKAKNQGDLLPYLRNVNVRWGEFDLADLAETRFAEEEKRHFDVRHGDIFVCEGGEPGRAAVWRDGDSTLLYQKALHRIRPYGECKPEWIAFFLRLSTWTGELSEAFTGTTIKHLPRESLLKVSLPIPPLPEQCRIVAKIDSLSARSKRAREELDRILRLVRKQKNAILEAAFRGDLTADWREKHPEARWSGHQQAGLNHAWELYRKKRRGSRLHDGDSAFSFRDNCGIPSSWIESKIGAVCDLLFGFAFKSSWYSRSGTRLVRGVNVSPGHINWDEVAFLPPERTSEFEEYRVKKGDIVLAMDRPIISDGLKVAMIDSESEGSILVQRVSRIRSVEFTNNNFMMKFICSNLFIEHVGVHATGSDLPHISGNDIATTPVPLPPPEEQHEIVRRIEAAFAWIDRLAAEAESARRLLDRLDQAVLAKAFRGELVPQDPADEPASVLLDRIRAERAAKGAVTKGRRGRPRKAETAA